MSHPKLRVLLIDDGSPHITMLDSELTQLGATVVGVLDSAMHLVERAVQLQPDVIIIAAESPTRDTLEHLAMMTQSTPRPIVLFTDDPNRERMQRALKAGVSSYVVEGLAPGRLRPVLEVAIARFEADAALRAELADALGKLSARKKIERAKGILMASRGLDEDAAYNEMRRMAMDRGVQLIKVAQQIIDAKALIS